MRVVQIGGNPGDTPRWWSEGEEACLPNSHHCLHVPSGLWDLVHGCTGHPACFGDDYDARVPSLAPDIRAPLTAAAWLAGRDPSMDAVRADLLKREAIRDRGSSASGWMAESR